MPVDLLPTHQWFNARYQEAQADSERYDVETARSIVCSYLIRYAEDGLTPLGVEVPFTLPLVDTESGKESGHTYSGIVDCVVQDAAGKMWFMDHKTASRVDKSYWQELKTNPQLTHYLLAAWQMDLPVEGFIWDVIQKPGIKPKDLTKKAIAELETGFYCGLQYKPGYKGETKETPQMYGLRVYVEYVENPDKYFTRENQYRYPTEILEYLKELGISAGRIDRLASGGQSVRSLSACKEFGRLCEFHQICSGDDPEHRGYRPRSVPGATARRTGSRSLSPSRVRTYQTCERKFVHRYVDGIEHSTKEYDSGLALGSLVHEGIENWLIGRIVDPIVFPNKGDDE